QETYDVVLAGVGRDQERRVAVLVPIAGETWTGCEQIGDALRVTATDRGQEVGDSAHEIRARERARCCRLRPQEGRGGLERLVPGAWETAFVALFRERPLAVPLAPRLLVVHLEAVAVGIREVDTDRDRVVGDADRDVLRLEPL